jgi:hypothetical protein
MGSIGLRLNWIPFRRGKPFEAVSVDRVRCKTAWEERTRRRVRISGRSKALKAKCTGVSGVKQTRKAEQVGASGAKRVLFGARSRQKRRLGGSWQQEKSGTNPVR